MNQHFMKISWQLLLILHRVRTAQEKPGKPQKRDFEKNHGKPGKVREFFYHFTTPGKTWNFILPNISDQIGCALRINE